MKGYKGFDKDLKCREMQYELGKTFTHNGPLSLCNSGLHFVQHPLDAWSYYTPLAGRFAEVEADGVSDEKSNDTKKVARSLTLKAEVKMPLFLKAAVEFVFGEVKSSRDVSATTGRYAHSATIGKCAHSATTGSCAHSATLGDYAHSATLGDSAHSAATGCSAHSATLGDYAHSATLGDYAHSATLGNYAHSATTGRYAHSATLGNYANSATLGDYAHSATTGDHAHSATLGYSAHSAVSGNQCIAASLGPVGQAKGVKGNWLVLAEWKDRKIKAMGIAHIDDKKIKADTFYELKGGKFVEVLS
jgi:hypothetical protein